MCYYISSTVVECCKFLETFPVICSFSNLSITVLGGADSIENVNYVDGHFHIVHCHKSSWRPLVSQLETCWSAIFRFLMTTTAMHCFLDHLSSSLSNYFSTQGVLEHINLNSCGPLRNFKWML